MATNHSSRTYLALLVDLSQQSIALVLSDVHWDDRFTAHDPQVHNGCTLGHAYTLDSDLNIVL
jgi:hypothetical protein